MTHEEHNDELQNVAWESVDVRILISNYIIALCDAGHITDGTKEEMLYRF